MGRKVSNKIEFDSPPTVTEMIGALEDLRAMVGGEAGVRVRGFIEINIDGPRVKAIKADRPAPADTPST